MSRRRGSFSPSAARSARPEPATAPPLQAPTARTTWGEKNRGLATSTKNERPHALLLGVYRPRALEGRDERAAAVDAVHAEWDDGASLDELERLADSAGIAVSGRVTQRLRSAHPGTYVNDGKAKEAALLADEQGCGLIIVDDELTPRQQRGLEEACGGRQRVIDRTVLILDIFAQRARTREAAVQVELAQLSYQLPRLARGWTHLERQRGGTGAAGGGSTGYRGPGETQIETDRRQIRGSLKRLERELETIRARRDVQRATRHGGWVCAALVGYTNAGKSTLLNRLAGSDIHAEDRLFATLDPTTRRWDLGEGAAILLTDTVGFIHKLQASLVAAFRATLEEVSAADVLVHLVNAAHPEALAQAEVALAEVAALGAIGQPVITALNKVDMMTSAAERARLEALRASLPGAVAISAATGEGCALLAEQVRIAARTVRRRRGETAPLAALAAQARD